MKSILYPKKVILGLAQLQSIYGVTNNKKERLSKRKSISILKYLDRSEIDEVDTAYSYPINIDLFRNTKKKIFFNTKISTSEIKNFELFNNYIKKIKKNKNIIIKTLFIHDGNNLLSKDGVKLFNKILLLKKKKIINKVGVSFHNYLNLKKILDKFKIDIIQIPFSIVDRRGKKYFKLIKKKKIEIQVRSIFLQGALLKKINSNFKLSKIYNKIKAKNSIDRVNILISFVLNEINIDKIVIGVRQVSELKMILNFSKLKFDKKIYRNLKTNDLDIIDPLKWKELNYHEKK
jgi:aryl-alcohol dehydrogenase-like predicted oxidoreductase